MSREELIQKAIEEWASVAGGPAGESEPSLAHYIEARLDAEYPNVEEL